jgi:hypothetical protein
MVDVNIHFYFLFLQNVEIAKSVFHCKTTNGRSQSAIEKAGVGGEQLRLSFDNY